jgi:hypothetical protein
MKITTPRTDALVTVSVVTNTNYTGVKASYDVVDFARTLERETIQQAEQIATLTRELQDASQVTPNERETILCLIRSMLSEQQQEDIGTTGRPIHMQVLRVLSALQESQAQLSQLTRERDEAREAIEGEHERSEAAQNKYREQLAAALAAMKQTGEK